ncbi:MAG TPA: cyclic nucleotide-binding domain-containing protein [Usitatibacter sp.]|nr:cyclic nucleotide-binding domain-containing protein [Usitatibacter sp.]
MAMDDMDFTKPQAPTPAGAPPAEAPSPFKAAASRFYDAAVAGQVFRAHGREERFAAGQPIFNEDDKTSRGGLFKTASRMYYLAEGQVALTMGGRPLDIVDKGEVFGEMAVISGQPRSAAAVAKGDAVAYSLDAGELQSALGRNPEFALMLASVMYDRLRFLAARLAARPAVAGAPPRMASAFEPKLVAQLEAALPRTAIVRHRQETLIMKEGQAGTFMYLVKSGKVAIAVGSNVVEVVGPGGTFGEMAVVDQSPRTARAGTIDETELLAIDRPSLLAVVKKEPEVAMALLRGIAERLRHMNRLLAQ